MGAGKIAAKDIDSWLRMRGQWRKIS